MGFNATQLAQASVISQGAQKAAAALDLSHASALTTTGGAVMGAIGSYYGAQSQASSLKFQSDMADINAGTAGIVGNFNADMGELAAQMALSAGQQQVAAQTLRAGQVKSSQRAAMAANGVDLGVGNAAEVQASTEIMKNTDMATLRVNAMRSAWGYRVQGMNAKLQSEVQANNYRTDAAMSRAAATNISPVGSAATSLLGSAGKVASAWYEYSQNKNTGRNIQYDSLDDLGTSNGWW